MRRYLSADIRRLVRRFPRWMIILLALFGLSVVVAVLAQLGLYGRWGAVTYVSAVKKLIKPLALIIGVVEIIFIFGDDLKAKTMQASIGAGLPRAELVMSKYIEIALFSLLDVIIYGLFIYAMGALFQAGLVASQFRELAICLFAEWLKVLGYTGLTMFVVYLTRGVAISMLVYIAFCTRIIDKVAGFLLSVGPMKPLHLDRYTMSTFIDTAETHLTGRVSALEPLLAVLAYIAFGCLAAILVFRKKELDL